MSCGVCCRRDPSLLWLWCRPSARALIRPLAWEHPYAEGVAQENGKKTKKKKKNQNESLWIPRKIQKIKMIWIEIQEIFLNN